MKYVRPVQVGRSACLGVVFVLSLALSACSSSLKPSETTKIAVESSSTNQVDSMSAMGDEMPADLDIARERTTDQGLYMARITSNLEPVDINQLHSWTLHLTRPDGQVVEDAEIVVDGGMPQHNHGFPTSPQVTENLGDGNYLIEGVRFNMTGWWEMKLNITAGGQSDQITFNLVVETGHPSEGMIADGLLIQHLVGNLALPTPTGAVYLTITNETDQEEMLVSVDVAGCDAIEFHETVMVDDIMKMQPVEGDQIVIPVGETVKLEQGGLHIMCIGKSQQFAVDDLVPVKLTFANAGVIEQTIEVRAPGDMAMGDSDHNHSSHDHHGTHDPEKISNHDATINIISPTNGDEIDTGQMITVTVETTDFDLTVEGNHWHLYVDGKLVEMIEDGRTETMIHSLANGEHTIMTQMANDEHVEFEEGAMIKVIVR